MAKEISTKPEESQAPPNPDAPLAPETSPTREAELTAPEAGKKGVFQKGSKKTVIQFKYKNYRAILNVADTLGITNKAGNRKGRFCLQARNWRYVFDLSDKKQKELYDKLMALPQAGVEFWELTPLDRKTDSITDRASTLQSLLSMKWDQLIGMMEASEWEEAGILPSHLRPESPQDKMTLVLAITENKFLKAGEGK